MRIHADKDFADLYNNYYTNLVSLASRRLLNPHKAEDIVQDNIVKLLEYNMRTRKKGYSIFVLKRNIIIQCAKENKQDKMQVELREGDNEDNS